MTHREGQEAGGTEGNGRERTLVPAELTERETVNPSRILVIDDDRGLASVCQQVLRRAGHEVQVATDGEGGSQWLQSTLFDLILTDLRMPGFGGLDVLRVSKESTPDVPVILFTGYPTVETAVQAIKEGAFDYLTKPFSPDQLMASVARALHQKRLVEENRELRARVEQKTLGAEMVGTSSAMLSVVTLMRRVAPTNANVLVLGESGTGKELVARGLHMHSRRQRKDFVAVDCAALPENLLESELFGHERGAFTNAVQRKVGLIEMADGGTVFLDEIGEMPMSLQAKLLRVLQERTVRRIGGRRWVPVDFRLVAATNRDLETMVQKGEFREDLYYRLNVVRIRLPSLDERREDIPLLASHFLRKHSHTPGVRARGFTEAALGFLRRRPWPGNVRELENVVERAVYLTDREYLDVSDLEVDATHANGGETAPAGPPNLAARRLTYAQAKGLVLDDFEERFLRDLLEHHRGNVSAAARVADVSRTTLQKLLRKHRLEPGSFRRRRAG
jgi:DNA-binding NtrC family response regulator